MELRSLERYLGRVLSFRGIRRKQRRRLQQMLELAKQQRNRLDRGGLVAPDDEKVASQGNAAEGEVMNQPWQSSSWVSYYRAALMEADRDQVLARITTAKKAIHDRMRELSFGARQENEPEMRAIHNALGFLGVLLSTCPQPLRKAG
ncbi:MAG TPA: hypothetical protein VEG30_17740 [Terriglobales bacterium]|nr:hypothetical protein [Terriglobales bacterium]